MSYKLMARLPSDWSNLNMFMFAAGLKQEMLNERLSEKKLFILSSNCYCLRYYDWKMVIRIGYTIIY